MSTMLLDLEDRIITDTGSMVAKHKLLVNLALSATPFSHLPFILHDDIELYHRHNNTKDALKWIDDNEPSSPALSTFIWSTPEPFSIMDVVNHCEELMINRGFNDHKYIDRLTNELVEVEQKDMTDFIRCLIWITDTLRTEGLVWGLGRGSSCASFIMFLLDVNKVDPVRYDIPMEEFYK